MNNIINQRATINAEPRAQKNLTLVASFLLLVLSAPQICFANSAEQTGQYTTTPVAQQAANSTVSKPNRGMNMSQVESQFGHPSQNLSPAGTPPIARWIYERFTVYFEDQYVIHSVQHR